MFDKVRDRLSVDITGTSKSESIIASLLDLETALGVPTGKATDSFAPEWIYLDQEGSIFCLYDHYNYSITESATEKISWSIGSHVLSYKFKVFIQNKIGSMK